jgi:hypothetical protein
MSTSTDDTRQTELGSSNTNGSNMVVDGRSEPATSPTEPLSAGEPLATDTYKADDRQLERSGSESPRLVEEHHIVGPRGDDEIEATDDRGRRWYHLRPEPRSRADLIGFNRTWWGVFLVFVLVVAFLPW